MARRAAGRPPLVAGERSAPLTVRLPETVSDRLYDRARRDRLSVPSLIRRAVDRLLEEEDDDRDD